MRAASLGASALLAAAMLAACGGSPDGGAGGAGGDGAGGGGATDGNGNGNGDAVAMLSAAQGIWQSAPGSASNTSAIVLPDGALWAVLHQGEGASATTQVLKANLSVQGGSYTVAGKSYTLGSTLSAPVILPAVTATVVEKTSLVAQLGPVPPAGTGTAPAAETVSLTWQARYDTSTRLADLAGAWSATLGPGMVNWNMDTQGRIAGTRTTGCTYTGQLSLRPEAKAVVDVAVLEDCAGTQLQFNGVGTPQAEGNRLTLVMATPDEAQAVLIPLGR